MAPFWKLFMGACWHPLRYCIQSTLQQLSAKIHGPPLLRNSKYPDGIPRIRGLHLIKPRAANGLYSFIRRLFLQLDKAGIVWTVENQLPSLLWEASYWSGIAATTDSFYCELRNLLAKVFGLRGRT